MKVTPLTATIGARVEGIDLNGEDMRKHAEAVRELLWKHQVLVLPGQHLSNSVHRDFVSCLGDLQPYPVAALFGDNETVFTIDERQVRPLEQSEKVVGLSAEYDAWHSDYTFASEIPEIATLRSERLPESGGDTAWTNMALAYETLSTTMQSFLEGLTAVHWYGPLLAQNLDLSKYGKDARKVLHEAFPAIHHPMVIAHHRTGQRALFVNPVYTVRIEGLSLAESNTILRMLFDHMAHSRFVFRHHWEQDDLILWDEQLTAHLAPVDAVGSRKMVRVSAGAVRPQPASPTP